MDIKKAFYDILLNIAKLMPRVKGDWMLFKQYVRDKFAKQMLMFSLSFFMGLLLLGASFTGGDSMSAITRPLYETKLRLFQPFIPGVDSGKTEPQLETMPEASASVDPEPEPVKTLRSPYVAAMPGGFVYSGDIPLNQDLQRYTYAKCVERGLEYETVLALMWRESRFELDAVNINKNGTQDSGVMQINDVNKDFLLNNYGIDNLMDPVQNIDAGTILLSMYMNKYGEHDALMAYQYGENGMEIQQEKGVVTNDLIELLYDRRDYYRELLRG